MFSYFLMKGMEGDADANKDNQITAGELHAYVLRLSRSGPQAARRQSFRGMLTGFWWFQ